APPAPEPPAPDPPLPARPPVPLAPLAPPVGVARSAPPSVAPPAPAFLTPPPAPAPVPPPAAAAPPPPPAPAAPDLPEPAHDTLPQEINAIHQKFLLAGICWLRLLNRGAGSRRRSASTKPADITSSTSGGRAGAGRRQSPSS